MKKLYAVRYKGSEEFVTWEGVPGTVAVWEDKDGADSELLYHNNEAETVVLLVPPTEPCERCQNILSPEDIVQMFGDAKIDGYSIKNLPVTVHNQARCNWVVCPNCGRRLTPCGKK